ncbi:hypothetical protein BV25DRAFT_1798124 [Artomyces pyxidatus]|uniref:Uncharacterized protein n=1 Tax=Artomyces pyxidatus TaxID=48021 RepID=A0ACB8TCF3_9AGAM|nr:hypothetical protein BV25DRAFT_1798124 [Artomyces pyxidatus]
MVNLHTREALPPIDTVYTFEQLIDHDNPSMGTFSQRYWTTWEFYKPGGPIILSTPGADSAEDYLAYLQNGTMNGQIAQQQHGATILLEHRFFGDSNPLPDLSTASFKYLTVQQVIDDLAYFAENVVLPMPGGDQVSPSKAPWILIGGTYSGTFALRALTAWTKVNKPDSFFIGYASSAVVESITNFWGFYEPIRLFMAPNCSADVQAASARIDEIFAGGNATAISTLKASFGMGDIVHTDDWIYPLHSNFWDWLDLQPDSEGGAFLDFCEALEVKDGVSAPASGWGGEHALAAWGSFWANGYYQSLCDDYDAEYCFGSYGHNASYWEDTSLNDAQRSSYWLSCTELGGFTQAPPDGYPSLISRLNTMSAYERRTQRICMKQFPEVLKTRAQAVPDVDKTNAAYGGWNLKAERLFFANGLRDANRYQTVSSGFVNISSTPEQPIAVSDAFQCSDLTTQNGLVNPSVLAVQKEGLSYIAKWLKEWKPSDTH